jgi:hemoglobin/transferrin/lactoferrin receptor protein
MKKFFTFLVCSFSAFGYAQVEKDTTKSINLNEINVSSYRFSSKKSTISQQIQPISKKEIEFQNSQNTADLFSNMGTLAVQKSQQGGGSPVIRGFEASRVLLLVDGIRMNNLIYRTGHLQNSITVDKNMLENVDVLFGSSSTIHGSDALGGAINYQTKNAKLLFENGNKKFSGNLLSNYSSVNEGKSGHLDFNFAGANWASLTSFSYNDYGDLKMGKQQNGSNEYFGERNYYIITENGVDKQILNEDKYVQKFTAYKQYDFMQKFVFKSNNLFLHNVNFQFSNSTDVPRYDRLTDVIGNGNLKNAVWNYGPQKRLLAAYKISKNKVFLDSDMNITVSYQNIEESRINRKVGNLGLENRIEKVLVFALNSDFKTKIGNGDFVYGVDFVFDDLKSTAFKKNIITGLESILDSRYPDGKNNSLSAEAFAYFHNNINTKSSYNVSFRGGYKMLKSEIQTNFLNLPYSNVEQKNFTYSSALGYITNPNKNVKIIVNLATAFRVPNVEDLTKIFESTAGNLIVPNNDLKPEKTVTADLGIHLFDGKKISFENTFFLTKIYDPIVTDVFTFNGQNTILYNGSLSTIQANQNQGQGTIVGFSSNLKAELFKNMFFYGNFNFTQGRIENSFGRVPLDHIAPVFGKTGFRFENKLLNLDLNMNYSGSKNVTDYSPSGEDNLIYAPLNGTPSWQIYNLKTGIIVSNQLTIFSGIENILDTQYRTFASGINAGGRNFYLGGKFHF